MLAFETRSKCEDAVRASRMTFFQEQFGEPWGRHWLDVVDMRSRQGEP